MKNAKNKINKALKVDKIAEILTGSDKGKKGKILSLLKKKNKVVVQGINLKFRHFKPNGKDKKGEIRQIELPIDCSNIKIIE